MRSREGAGRGCSLGRAPPTGPRAPQGSQRGGVRQDPAVPPTPSRVLALNPKRVKLKLFLHSTLCGAGPTTQLALEIWRAGPATRTLLTLQMPATVWAQSRKPGSRQLRNMPTAETSVRVGARGGVAAAVRGPGSEPVSPLRFRCALPLLRAFPRRGSAPRAVLFHLRFGIPGVYPATAPPPKTVSAL